MDQDTRNDEPRTDMPVDERDGLDQDDQALAGAVGAAQLGITPGTGVAGALHDDDEVQENGAP